MPQSNERFVAFLGLAFPTSRCFWVCFLIEVVEEVLSCDEWLSIWRFNDDVDGSVLDVFAVFVFEVDGVWLLGFFYGLSTLIYVFFKLIYFFDFPVGKVFDEVFSIPFENFPVVLWSVFFASLRFVFFMALDWVFPWIYAPIFGRSPQKRGSGFRATACNKRKPCIKPFAKTQKSWPFGFNP